MAQVGNTDNRIKKLNQDGSYEEISYITIYNLGLILGLSVQDINVMTMGEILDLVNYRVNQEEKRKEQKTDNRVNATQADYDNF